MNDMELMQRQMKEKNRVAFTVAVIITGIELALALLSFTQTSTGRHADRECNCTNGSLCSGNGTFDRCV